MRERSQNAQIFGFGRAFDMVKNPVSDAAKYEPHNITHHCDHSLTV